MPIRIEYQPNLAVQGISALLANYLQERKRAREAENLFAANQAQRRSEVLGQALAQTVSAPLDVLNRYYGAELSDRFRARDQDREFDMRSRLMELDDQRALERIKQSQKGDLDRMLFPTTGMTYDQLTAQAGQQGIPVGDVLRKYRQQAFADAAEAERQQYAARELGDAQGRMGAQEELGRQALGSMIQQPEFQQPPVGPPAMQGGDEAIAPLIQAVKKQANVEFTQDQIRQFGRLQHELQQVESSPILSEPERMQARQNIRQQMSSIRPTVSLKPPEPPPFEEWKQSGKHYFDKESGLAYDWDPKSGTYKATSARTAELDPATYTSPSGLKIGQYEWRTSPSGEPYIESINRRGEAEFTFPTKGGSGDGGGPKLSDILSAAKQFSETEDGSRDPSETLQMTAEFIEGAKRIQSDMAQKSQSDRDTNLAIQAAAQQASQLNAQIVALKGSQDPADQQKLQQLVRQAEALLLYSDTLKAAGSIP